MSQHAKLMAPSAAEKWSNCVGSPVMEEGIPDGDTTYADEGTAAHFLAALCLNENQDPVAYIRREICVTPDGDAFFVGQGATEARTFGVDEEMVSAVRKYVQRTQKAAEGGELMVERRLDISMITGEEGASGIGDAVILLPGELQVRDLKYGVGIRVFAANNKQLLIYALAAYHEFSQFADFERVRIVIHQPRISAEPDEWVITVEELLAFEAEIKDRAKLVLTAYEFRSNWQNGPDYSYLTPGEKQCRWCRAKDVGKCPAFDKAALESVIGAFENLDANTTPETTITEATEAIKLAEDPAVLADKFQSVPLVRMWCDTVEKRATAVALSGVKLPGLKVVLGREGNRAWSDAEAVEAELKAKRLKADDIYDKKLISPPTAEKRFGEGGTMANSKLWKKLQTLITRAPGARSLVPESDKRKEVDTNVAAQFDNLNDGSDLA